MMILGILCLLALGFLIFLAVVVAISARRHMKMVAEMRAKLPASLPQGYYRPMDRFGEKVFPINPRPLDVLFREASREKGWTDRRPSLGLPTIETPDELVTFLGLRDYRQLAGLIGVSHYHWYELDPDKPNPRGLNYWVRAVPKRGGTGKRIICAPKPRLKAVQHKILREILDKVPAHPAAQGFRRGASIETHAGRHVGKRVVVACDLRDFFPRLAYWRVEGFFMWLGYPFRVARALALLCTIRIAGYPEARPGMRGLAQGAPTSPALANALVYRMDARLAGLAKRFGGEYSRYADDLAFSGGREFHRDLRRFMYLMRRVVKESGLQLHPDKTRVMRPATGQRVTGLNVVNGLTLGRKEYDTLKAILHRAKKAGSLESQNREDVANIADHLAGRVAWYRRFHPERGERLMRQLAELRGNQPPPAAPLTDFLPPAPPPE